MDVRIENADTIICFNLSNITCLYGYLKRYITNLNKSRSDIADGCQERLEWEFIKYIWKFPTTSGKQNAERLGICKKQVIVFDSRHQANEFLKQLESKA